MKIVTTLGESGIADYKPLYEVFSHSVAKNTSAELVCLPIECPKKSGHHTDSLAMNHVKMLEWARYIETVDDDVVFMDCDMMVLRDIGEAFNDFDFDIAITKRDRHNLPFNGGVVFVRNTKAAHAFIKLWAEVDTQLWEDEVLHVKWRKKAHGMNQASLAYILNDKLHTDTGAMIAMLPCERYNAVEEHWSHIVAKQAYAVHCKGNMKRVLLSGKAPDKRHMHMSACFDIWQKLRVEAQTKTVPAEATDSAGTEETL